MKVIKSINSIGKRNINQLKYEEGETKNGRNEVANIVNVLFKFVHFSKPKPDIKLPNVTYVHVHQH